MDERLRLLSGVTLFRELRPKQLAPIAATTEVVVFEPDQYLMLQGDPGDSVYVIVEGRVDVIARAEHDTTGVVISSLNAGDTVGELALLDGKPRSASCVALNRTVCLRLGRDAFLTAARRHWPLSRALFGVLAERLRYADERMAEHARDPLTGLYNRRALGEFFERERARFLLPGGAERRHTVVGDGNDGRGARSAEPRRLALLFTDVNDFKQINDTYGHQVGDEVLCGMARTLLATVRASDMAARYGGDEFVVLMPDTTPEGAAQVASRLRQLLRERPPGPVAFSASVGVAEADPHCPPTLDELLAEADRAMYRDKAEHATAGPPSWAD